MDPIFGTNQLGWVALKALLLYLTAIFAFRLGKRRILAEMTPFDFVAAVAVGAIIGGVPSNPSASYLHGTVTLVTILVAHAAITTLRRHDRVRRLVDFPPRLLVANGRLDEAELIRCGLTREDMFGRLREGGIKDLAEVRYVVFEEDGRISIVRARESSGGEPPLVRDVVNLTRGQSPAGT